MKRGCELSGLSLSWEWNGGVCLDLSAGSEDQAAHAALPALGQWPLIMTLEASLAGISVPGLEV